MSARNVIFIDSRIEDYAGLVESLSADTDWHLLDPLQDGVRQMARVLANYTDLASIHVVSHGSPGALYLGRSVLNTDSLSAYRAELDRLGDSLGDAADILLYGCDVAQGEDGLRFINALSDATGADVAASDDLSGPSRLGGNGALEIATGQIQAVTIDLGSLPQTLDATRNDGIVTTKINAFSFGSSFDLLENGKILAVGRTGGDGLDSMAIARFNADGTLDTSFSGDGKLAVSITGSSEYANSVVGLADGKILVAGTSYNGTNRDVFVSRFNADGTLDTTFGSAGKRFSSFESDFSEDGFIAVQSDGKILLASTTDDDRFSVSRFNADGSVDSSFGFQGTQTVRFFNESLARSLDTVRGVSVDEAGNILVVGVSSTSSFGYSYPKIALVRYTSDGLLDSSFGASGKVTTAAASRDVYGESIALQPDGKILVVGRSYDSNNWFADDDVTLVRYNPDGSVDTTFGQNGVVVTAISPADDQARSVAVQPDGKILIAGWVSNGGTYDFLVARYQKDGSLDTSFGNQGIVLLDISQDYDIANHLMVQPDGKILVGGTSNNGDQHEIALVRLNSNGTLDTSFDPASTDSGGTSNNAPVISELTIRDGYHVEMKVTDSDAQGLSAYIGSALLTSADGHSSLMKISSDTWNFSFSPWVWDWNGSNAKTFAGQLRIADDGSPMQSVDTGLYVYIGTLGADSHTVSSNSPAILYGFGGDDTLIGGGGDDTISGGEGADLINGGLGNNTVTYAYSSRVDVYLYDSSLNQFGNAAGDVLTNIQNVIGSNLNDIIHGDEAQNILQGGAGGDWLTGHGGADRFVLGPFDSLAPTFINRLNTGVTTETIRVGDWIGFEQGVDQVKDFSPSELDKLVVQDPSRPIESLLGVAPSVEISSSNMYVAYGSWDGYKFVVGDQFDSQSNHDALLLTDVNSYETSVFTSRSIALLLDLEAPLVQSDFIGQSDENPPVVTGFSPADGSTNVAVNSNLSVTFDESIQLGSGYAYLRVGSPTGGVVETFDIATSNRVSVLGATLVIDPTNDLSGNTQYFLTLDSGVVKDAAGNAYAGTTSYDFATMAVDTQSPFITGLEPGDGASWVARGADIAVTFSESIQRGTGKIYLRTGSADGSLIEQYDVAMSQRIAIEDNTLTIDPVNDLESNTQYFVTFESGIVEDVMGNAFDGMNTYDFKTGLSPVNTPPTFLTPGDGVVSVDFGDGYHFGTSVVAAPDGTIFFAAKSDTADGKVSLYRLDANGDPVASFPEVVSFIAEDWVVSLPNVLIQDDDKVIFVYGDKLTRINPDGSVDKSFGVDGFISHPVQTHHAAIDPLGNILVSGRSDPAIYRYTTEGVIDTSFSSDGLIGEFFGTNFAGSVLHALPDGSFLIAGSDFLKKYSGDGLIDSTFAQNGSFIFPWKESGVLGSNDFTVTSLAVQSDGKILVGGLLFGLSGIEIKSSITVMRFNADGSLDNSFADDGIFDVESSTGVLQSAGLSLQADGKILVAGSGPRDSIGDVSGNGPFVIRLNDDGSYDSLFGAGGGSGVSGLWSVRDIALQKDGRILLVGEGESGVSVVRLNQDGSTDLGFDGSPVSTLSTVVSGYEGAVIDPFSERLLISDTELSARENFDGTTLTVSRHLGANPQDSFIALDGLLSLQQGAAIQLTSDGMSSASTSLGVVTTNSGGMLELNFNANATQDLVNQVLNAIGYQTAVPTEAATVRLDWVFSDGNTSGQQGDGGVKTTTLANQISFDSDTGSGPGADPTSYTADVWFDGQNYRFTVQDLPAAMTWWSRAETNRFGVAALELNGQVDSSSYESLRELRVIDLIKGEQIAARSMAMNEFIVTSLGSEPLLQIGLMEGQTLTFKSYYVGLDGTPEALSQVGAAVELTLPDQSGSFIQEYVPPSTATGNKAFLLVPSWDQTTYTAQYKLYASENGGTLQEVDLPAGSWGNFFHLFEHDGSLWLMASSSDMNGYVSEYVPFSLNVSNGTWTEQELATFWAAYDAASGSGTVVRDGDYVLDLLDLQLDGYQLQVESDDVDALPGGGVLIRAQEAPVSGGNGYERWIVFKDGQIVLNFALNEAVALGYRIRSVSDAEPDHIYFQNINATTSNGQLVQNESSALSLYKVALADLAGYLASPPSAVPYALLYSLVQNPLHAFSRSALVGATPLEAGDIVTIQSYLSAPLVGAQDPGAIVLSMKENPSTAQKGFYVSKVDTNGAVIATTPLMGEPQEALIDPAYGIFFLVTDDDYSNEVAYYLNPTTGAVTEIPSDLFSYIEYEGRVTDETRGQLQSILSGMILGTEGNDTLIGGDGGDVISGLGGNDRLTGKSGDDELNGGSGEDVHDGGPGDDFIDGGSDWDIALYPGTGTWYESGGQIVRNLDQNGQPIFMQGIEVRLADGTVTGDPELIGTDILRSVEDVRGTINDDWFDARGFSDQSTNAGSFGTRNSFRGGAGDDTIIGNGDTRIDYRDALAGVWVDLQEGVAMSLPIEPGDSADRALIGMDTLYDINRVYGSMHGDYVVGGDTRERAELLFGLGGNDTLEGGSALTLFFGGAGNDSIVGGNRSSAAVYSGNFADFDIDRVNGKVVVTDTRDGAPEGQDTIEGISVLRFDDRDYFVLGQANRSVLVGKNASFNVGNGDMVVGTQHEEIFNVSEYASPFIFTSSGDTVSMSGSIEDYSIKAFGNQLHVSELNGINTTFINVSGPIALATTTGYATVSFDFDSKVMQFGDRVVDNAGFDSFAALELYTVEPDDGQWLYGQSGLVTIPDFKAGVTGDMIEYGGGPLFIGGSASAASDTIASINEVTGVATFAVGSGTTLDDALADIAAAMQAASDGQGAVALFQVAGTGDFHLFLSDGQDGVTASDIVLALGGTDAVSRVHLEGDQLLLVPA